MSAVPAGPPTATPPDAYALVRTRGYVVLLVMTALLGIPVSAVAFGFLALVSELQSLTYTDLPRGWASTERPRGGRSRSSPWAACWWP